MIKSDADREQNWKLQPQREVLVRLKYATVLYEETENTAEAEEALNKGVGFQNFTNSVKC